MAQSDTTNRLANDRSAVLLSSATPLVPVTITPTPTSALLQGPDSTVTSIPPSGEAGEADACTYPLDWQEAIVAVGDTLDSLAARYGSTSETLAQGNCLAETTLEPGQTIRVPPLPVATEDACGPPSDWVPYTVKSGENLFRIGLRYGQKVDEMLRANCLVSDRVDAGQTLFVPPVQPIPPTATAVGSTSGGSSDTVAGCPDSGAQITSPLGGGTLNDIIFFYGTAQAADFAFYKLEIRPASGGEFITFDGTEQTVTANFLGQVAAYAFAPGEYVIRLAVVDTNSDVIGTCEINVILQGGPSDAPMRIKLSQIIAIKKQLIGVWSGTAWIHAAPGSQTRIDDLNGFT